ncbi:MAG: YhcB family protein [Pseudomonadales bacterium]
MDPNLLLAAAVVASASLGLLVGVVAGKRSAAGFKRSQQLETELSNTQLELDSYKKEVEKHFSETADAFKTMNESYATLHQKLAGGAVALCGQTTGPLLDAPISVAEASEPDPANERQSELPLEPPRDYAPKKSPDEKGMLTEDFGLDKANQPANDAA